MPAQNDAGTIASVPRTNLKAGMTPNTISTSGTRQSSTRSSATALDSTPGTINTFAYSTTGKENSSTSIGTEKSTKDILAQWRLERQQSRNKLGDLMNMENAKQTAAVVVQGPPAEKKSVVRNVPSRKDDSNDTDDEIDDRFLDAILRDRMDQSTLFDAANSTDDQVHDGNSIRTTPTSNTVLNAMGLDRMSNRTNESLGVTSLNVRLFQPICEDNESQCSQDHLQEDVSLITQDTELQSMMRPFDVDRMIEEIEREQFSRLVSQKAEETRQSSSSLHSKGILEALSSLQSSLEKSRAARNEQEIELANQKEVINALQKENISILESRERDTSAVHDCTTLLLDELKNVAELCGGGISIQDKFTNKPKDMTSLRYAVDLVKDMAKKSIPSILDAVKEQKRQANDVVIQLENATKELNNVKKQIAMEKQGWNEDKSNLHEHVEILRSDFSSVQTKLAKCNVEMSTNLSHLQQTRKDIKQKEEDLNGLNLQLGETRKGIKQKEEDLNGLNLQLGEKHLDLEEITRLCEERIQSAHVTECNAKAQADAVIAQEAEIQELHNAAMERYKSIKAAEAAFLLKRDEEESNRFALEAKLQLKRDQLQEQHDDLLEMTASFESRRMKFQTECERVQEVQNDLLQKEKSLADDEKAFEEETAALIIASENLEKREGVLRNAESNLADRTKRLEKEYQELEEELELRDIQVRQMQDDLDQEREQYMDRLKALEQGEAQLKADCKELSGRVSKFKTTVKAAKSETERKKSELQKLENEIRHREGELLKRSKALAEEKIAFDELKCRENAALVKATTECASKQQEFASVKKKAKDTANGLKQLHIEVAKVRGAVEARMRVAKDELKSIGATFTAQQRELVSLDEEVSGTKMLYKSQFQSFLMRTPRFPRKNKFRSQLLSQKKLETKSWRPSK